LELQHWEKNRNLVDTVDVATGKEKRVFIAPTLPTSVQATSPIIYMSRDSDISRHSVGDPEDLSSLRTAAMRQSKYSVAGGSFKLHLRW
jgi:hypothetical protein